MHPVEAAYSKYQKLTPKARRILHAIIAGDQPVTRDDIAAELGQPRLYAHDLKLLSALEAAGFIGSHLTRRHNRELERSGEYRFMIENYERHWGSSYKAARWGMFDQLWEYWADRQIAAMIRGLKAAPPPARMEAARPPIKTFYPSPAIWYRFLEWLGLY